MLLVCWPHGFFMVIASIPCVFFEANGHGTLLFSKKLVDKMQPRSSVLSHVEFGRHQELLPIEKELLSWGNVPRTGLIR